MDVCTWTEFRYDQDVDLNASATGSRILVTLAIA